MKSTFKKSPNFVPRVIGGELILVPLKHSKDGNNFLYTLNKDAQDVWDSLGAARKTDDVIKNLSKNYEETGLKSKTEKIIKELYQIGALV